MGDHFGVDQTQGISLFLPAGGVSQCATPTSVAGGLWMVFFGWDYKPLYKGISFLRDFLGYKPIIGG